MKDILFLSLVFIIGCANDKGKTPESAPVRDTLASAKVEPKPAQDSTLIIHPNATMDKVLLDVNGHINSIPKTGNLDKDFIEIVKVHNQAIMEMAYMEVVKGKNATLTKWASDILTKKKAENTALEKIKNKVTANQAHNDLFQQDISHQLKDKLYLPPTSTLSVDEQFAILLVPHHMTAISMGNIFLKYSTNAELKRFTNNMIEEYEQEVKKMEPIEKDLKL